MDQIANLVIDLGIDVWGGDQFWAESEQSI